MLSCTFGKLSTYRLSRTTDSSETIVSNLSSKYFSPIAHGLGPGSLESFEFRKALDKTKLRLESAREALPSQCKKGGRQKHVERFSPE